MSGDIDKKIENFVERVMEKARPSLKEIESRFEVAARAKAAEVLKEFHAARTKASEEFDAVRSHVVDIFKDFPVVTDVIHPQPVSEHVDIFADIPAVPANQGVTMPSPVILKILPLIPQLVIAAEVAYQGTTGSGADKLAAVLAAITPLVPNLDSDGANKVAAYINTIVMIYNMVHPMFQKQSGQA